VERVKIDIVESRDFAGHTDVGGRRQQRRTDVMCADIPPQSMHTRVESSAASDVYQRQSLDGLTPPEYHKRPREDRPLNRANL